MRSPAPRNRHAVLGGTTEGRKLDRYELFVFPYTASDPRLDSRISRTYYNLNSMVEMALGYALGLFSNLVSQPSIHGG